MLTLYALLTLQHQVNGGIGRDSAVLDNGLVSLTVHAGQGRYDVVWRDKASLRNVVGEARVGGVIRRTTDFSQHLVDASDVRDKFGKGIRIVAHHRNPGQPELRQTFWVYENRPEVLVRLEIVGKDAASNYLAPAVTETPVKLDHRGPLQSLFVPWDNDMYFRYNSDGWGEGEGNGDGSYEVGALYDDTTRRGLVVGSIDHDLWKSAVRFYRNGGLKAFAGVTSKYTHDSQPHGTVTGSTVASPRMVLGLYDDWRNGLERYGDLNAVVKAPLAWKGSVPFGWNSWSGHKTKVNATHARAATDFIATELPGFRSGGTAYVNFDSYWSNLNQEELKAFVARAHGSGLKTGIYWTPFACWGGLEKPVDPGSKFKFRDICLKDAKGELLPQLDGAYPIDPTHPETLAHIDREMKKFVDLGFDYVKLDFLSHGAVEGQHFDPKVTTGTQAYALGMQRVVDDLSPSRVGRPFFISLSIAPMFPHGYAHSRRISCDVFANIGASEYFLNSANYGWWTAGRLYRFNDPDSACVYQPMDEPPVTEAEARTRFTASAIGGGMMIQGDDLTKPEARERVKRIFSNREILDLARHAPQFLPVDGDTGSKAGDAFFWKQGKSVYVAVFNFDKMHAKTRTIPTSRLALTLGAWCVHDLWTGAERQSDGDLVFELPPMDCALVRLDQVR